MLEDLNTGALYFNDRLQESLEALQVCPLTVVEAPMGYGKTVGVREFLRGLEKRGEGAVIWVTVFSGCPESFWRDLCRKCLKRFPRRQKDIQAICDIGYPKDSVREDAVFEIIQQLDLPEKVYLVIDDYQLLPDQGVGNVCELLAQAEIPNLHLVLITRNTYGGKREILQLKGLYNHVGRDAFALTAQEIAAYYALCGVAITEAEAEALYAQTAGWLSALYLYLLRHAKNGASARPETLQGLVDKEVYQPLRAESKDLLFAVAPLEYFTLEQAVYLDPGDDTEILLDELQERNSFITFDEVSGHYSLHSIFRTFMLEQLGRLPVSRQRCIHRKIGDWHMSRHEATRGLAAYYQAGDYEKFLQILEADMASHTLADNDHLFIKFFRTCPEEIMERHMSAAFKFAIASFSTGNTLFFKEQCDWLTKKCAEIPEDDPEVGIRRGELHILHSFLEFNDISAMSAHHRKAGELLGGPTRLYGPGATWTLGSPSIMFMFYRQSGCLRDELEKLRECLPIYRRLTGEHGAGGDTAMQAEIMYQQGEFAEAEILAHKAQAQAMEHRQLGVAFCTLFLRMRLALAKGKPTEAELLLKEMRCLLSEKRDYYLLQTIDLCKGAVYGAAGRLGDIPCWLKNESEKNTRLFAVADGYYYIVHGRYLLMTGNFAKAAGLFEYLLEAGSFEKYRLFEIYACIYIAAALKELGKKDTAQAVLRRALKTALPDMVYMPFVENHDFISDLLTEISAGAEPGPGLARIFELAERFAPGV